jgi:hypothetical protein
MRRTLYLDTNLWNNLCGQSIVPQPLVTRLRTQGWDLVFSPHLRYELAKTYRSKRPQAIEKARLLFSCLEEFLNLRIPCVKQLADLLREEVRHVCNQIRTVECFYRDELYEREAVEIRKLATGNIDVGNNRVLDFREKQVVEFREASPERTAMWRMHTEYDPGLTLEEFMEFGLRTFGQHCLIKHVSQFFPNLAEKHLRRISKKLLSAPRYRVSQALVRGDIYLDWRCFHERGIARDTSDDCFHIENAAYCDTYATAEVAQRKYAEKILTKTSVRIYDRNIPLIEWLTSNAISNQRSR